MDQERLGGVADAWPVDLRVERNRGGLLKVGGAINVDVAVA
uniref:Unannotated protein n=1 Tax=freshwater metagenome TaxID=449393 RepID=A0A6J6A778_9ZZZZ